MDIKRSSSPHPPRASTPGPLSPATEAGRLGRIAPALEGIATWTRVEFLRYRGALLERMLHPDAFLGVEGDRDPGAELRSMYRALLEQPRHPLVEPGPAQDRDRARLAFIEAELKLLTTTAKGLDGKAHAAIEWLIQEGLQCEERMQDEAAIRRLGAALFGARSVGVPSRSLGRRIASAVSRELAAPVPHDSPVRRLAGVRFSPIPVPRISPEDRIIHCLMSAVLVNVRTMPVETPEQRHAVMKRLRSVIRYDEASLPASERRERVRSNYNYYCAPDAQPNPVLRECGYFALMDRQWKDPQQALREVARLEPFDPAGHDPVDRVRYVPVLRAMGLNADGDLAAANAIFSRATAGMAPQEAQALIDEAARRLATAEVD